MISGIGKFLGGRKGLPTPVVLPGEFHRQRSLVGYSPWGHKESDMTKRLTLKVFLTSNALWFWQSQYIYYFNTNILINLWTKKRKLYSVLLLKPSSLFYSQNLKQHALTNGRVIFIFLLDSLSLSLLWNRHYWIINVQNIIGRWNLKN